MVKSRKRQGGLPVVPVREIKGQEVRPFVILGLLIAGIVVMWSSTLYVQLRADSGSFWASEGYDHVEVQLNSSAPEINVTIQTVRLRIPHFNVSEGNASILVRAANGTVLSNLSLVAGDFIPGVLSHSSIPDSSFPVQAFTVSLFWEGANNTVTFDYEEYALAFWDGVPYAVFLPGFYERLWAGLCLLAASVILFLFTTWNHDPSSHSGMHYPEFILLVSGFLLPTLLRLMVLEQGIAFFLFSSIWYYATGLTAAVAPRISSTIELFPDIFALAGLPLNILLCLSIWLSSRNRISNRIHRLLLCLSFVPQILALLATAYVMIMRYSPVICYIPVPILQVAAYRLRISWASSVPDKGMILQPEGVLVGASLLAVLAPIHFSSYSSWWGSYWQLSAWVWTFSTDAGLRFPSSAFETVFSLLLIMVRLAFALVLYRYCQQKTRFMSVLLMGILAEMPYLAVDLLNFVEQLLLHGTVHSAFPTPMLFCFGLIIAVLRRHNWQGEVAKSTL